MPTTSKGDAMSPNIKVFEQLRTKCLKNIEKFGKKIVKEFSVETKTHIPCLIFHDNYGVTKIKMGDKYVAPEKIPDDLGDAIAEYKKMFPTLHMFCIPNQQSFFLQS